MACCTDTVALPSVGSPSITSPNPQLDLFDFACPTFALTAGIDYRGYTLPAVTYIEPNPGAPVVPPILPDEQRSLSWFPNGSSRLPFI